ncbi:18564_t:CDS:2, partial [Dentiscutata erythropus]
DQPVTFLEEFQNNISFTEYGDGDNLAAIWAAAIYDNPINIEHLATTYDNPIDVERLTTIYDDPINIEKERLATVQDDTIDVEENIYLEDIQDQDDQLKLQETVEVKKALNLALDLNCEDEFLDMISNFITRKKSSIESTSNEENLCVLDPLVQKQHGHRPNKYIKSATKKSHHSSSGNSTINPPDPNLTSRKRHRRPPKSVSEKKANQNNSDNVLLNVSD